MRKVAEIGDLPDIDHSITVGVRDGCEIEHESPVGGILSVYVVIAEDTVSIGMKAFSTGINIGAGDIEPSPLSGTSSGGDLEGIGVPTLQGENIPTGEREGDPISASRVRPDGRDRRENMFGKCVAGVLGTQRNQRGIGALAERPGGIIVIASDLDVPSGARCIGARAEAGVCI